MCKIIMLSNTSKLKNFTHFAKTMRESLEDMSDGFGYAAYSKKGIRVFKTTDSNGVPEVSWVKGAGSSHINRHIKPTGAAIFHGRISTNDISLVNTHPIDRQGTYLIHNGVVTNKGETYQKNTTNDSEDVLYHYLSGGIDKVAESLSGYYACGVISPNGELSVWRDAIAPLYYAWVDVLETHVFATTESLILDVAEYANTDVTIHQMTDDTYLRFKNNKMIMKRTFNSKGYGIEESRLAFLSLGRTDLEPLPTITDDDAYGESTEFNDDGPIWELGEQTITDDEYRTLDEETRMLLKRRA